jgi:vacuolar-type H+-ATPase subunit H
LSTDYTETLKKIKDTEEAASREVLEKRKALEEELRRMEDAAAQSIAEAKRKGEALIADEVDKAAKAAQTQADAMVSATEKESQQTAGKKLDKASLKKIVDGTILAEFK